MEPTYREFRVISDDQELNAISFCVQAIKIIEDEKGRQRVAEYLVARYLTPPSDSA